MSESGGFWGSDSADVGLNINDELCEQINNIIIRTWGGGKYDTAVEIINLFNAGNVMLRLWVHGSASFPDKPCGEVDVIAFSGKNIRIEFIESVIDQADNGDIMAYLGGLPTEQWLDVLVHPVGEDIGWSFSVVEYKPIPKEPEEENKLALHNVNNPVHCDKHGGYGFMSDCIVCKQEKDND